MILYADWPQWLWTIITRFLKHSVRHMDDVRWHLDVWSWTLFAILRKTALINHNHLTRFVRARSIVAAPLRTRHCGFAPSFLWSILIRPRGNITDRPSDVVTGKIDWYLVVWLRYDLVRRKYPVSPIKWSYVWGGPVFDVLLIVIVKAAIKFLTAGGTLCGFWLDDHSWKYHGRLFIKL